MRSSARRAGAWTIVVATIVGIAVLLGVVAPRWWSGEGGTYAPRSTATSSRIEPASALFGDVLTARATVLVDTRAIEPDTVLLYGRFAPYRIIETTRSVTRHVGHAARVDYAFRLQCLTASCLDAMEREGTDGRLITTPIAFPPAELGAQRQDGSEWTAELRWPSVVVRSRLSPKDIATGEPRPPAFRAPETNYRLPPTLLGWVLLAFAGVLGLVGAAFVASTLHGRVAARRLLIPAHLSPLDRALALARHAAAQGDTAGERRALERLAAELRRHGDRELAIAARRLAWSAGEPTEQGIEELAAAFGQMGNGH